ncbi:LOW QUALITY PROTEIN: A-kinase anchor protein 6 [Hippocampus zosterae]|uniref:LOW QUALITY PROTEIN: A-kinase anchor protein 6 n=1 Tax=Hippocampus zosterae TaxID=109293 RepID=UPI00223DE3C2|nr:LOW QUALITY PROTEIN: A-kinase anchor protein 6 [Hippocampus zosterae]
MSAMALSPLSPEPPCPAPDLEQGVAPLARPAKRRMTTPAADDVAHRANERRPPPVQACADWQVLLHLPQTEAWLRASGARVTRLTSSVAQDADNRHVDTHLLQLKDICEDISDHVEQIHALLETELSLKLLSYSVNVIVDIRTVQLLWHQLRVSVLVLKERLLRGLQDPNGNFTGRTDILQAFTRDPDPDPNQTRRLDTLTEVDERGRLTIRCSRDYFSLDCGITAYELSDYSPGEEPETGGNRDAPTADSQGKRESREGRRAVLSEGRPDSGDGPATNQNELAKRSLSADGRDVAPSLPKRVALISDHEAEDNRGVSDLPIRARPNRSRPADLVHPLAEDLLMEDPLMGDPPAEGHLAGPAYRSNFWLELDSLCPENTSEAIRERKQVANAGNVPEGPAVASGSPFGDGDSDSSAASPAGYGGPSSDPDASGEDSDPRPAAGKGKMLSWPGKQSAGGERWFVLARALLLTSSPWRQAGPERQRWYGSEDFLALPAQIRESESLAINLESLARALRPGGEDLCPEALQDVDDWDLTELNQDNWDSAESGDDAPVGFSCFEPLAAARKRNKIGSGKRWQPPPPHLLQVPMGRDPPGRLSPASSGDAARSSDESIECGRLSEPLSEEAAQGLPEPAAPPLDRCGSATLLRQLLEDFDQDKDPDVWSKLEKLVGQLDGFIGWLQGALESTGDWTPPEANLDALKLYLDTHLAFKLNVERHNALKESIVEDATALLAMVPAHAQQSGLRDILRMVSGQWEQLRLQIRRQHAWMLRALRLIRARLLLPAEGPPPERPQAEPPSSLWDACQDALQEMAAELGGLRDLSPADRPRDFEPAPEETIGWERQPRPAPPPASLRTQDGAVPPSGDVPERLRAGVEELKAWLRRTELLIHDACLRRPRRDSRRQLASFKTLCSDVRARRRGVSRLLKLCRRLLRQKQPGPGAEPEPDGEDLRLLSINLERRWEAVLMQTLHWRNRLKRELGERTAAGNFAPSGRRRPERASPVPAPSTTSPPDDCWEWDETDMTPAEEPPPDLTHDLPCSVDPAYAAHHALRSHGAPELPRPTERKRRALRKSPSRDSTFSSAESLPDLLGGLTEGPPRRRGGGGGRRSGSESGIVSDAGDGDAIPRRGRRADEGEGAEPVPPIRQGAEEEGEPLSPEEAGAERPEISEKDQDDRADVRPAGFLVRRPWDHVAGPAPGPVSSPGSSLESLLSPGRELFSFPAVGRDPLSPPEPRRGAGSRGELSTRTLDLLKRLENIRSPPASEMTRSLSDSTLRGGSPLRPGGAQDSSAGSEDPAGLPKRGKLPAGGGGRQDEADGVSLSMVVNVSRASACTDDEDDSDLLSSSTLTLSEEEMGVREEDEEFCVPPLDPMKEEPRARAPHPRTSRTPVGLWDELRCGSDPERGRLLHSSPQGHEEEEEEEEESFIGRFADDLENGNAEPSGSRDADDELLREESAVLAERGEPRALGNKGLGDSFDFTAAEEDVEPLASRAPTAASSLVGQLQGELPCRGASPSGGRKAITVRESFKFSSLVTEESRSKLRDKRSCLPGKKWKGSHASPCRHRQPPSAPSPPSPQAKEAVHDFVMEILDLTAEARRSKEIPGPEPPSGSGRSDAQRGPASFRHIRAKVAQHSHQPLHLRKGDFYAYLSLSSHDSDCGEVARCAEDKSAAPAPYLLPAAAAARAPPLESADPAPSLSPDVRDEETLFPACAEEVYPGPPLRYGLPPARYAFSKALPEKGARLPDPEEVPSVTSARDEAEVPEVEGPPPVRGAASAVREPPRGSVEGEAAGRRLGGCAAPGGREEARGLEAPSYLNPRPRVALIDSSPAQCLADTKTPPSNIAAVMTKISGGGGATNPSKEPPAFAASAARMNPQMNRGPIKEADRAPGVARGAKRPEGGPAAGPRPREAKRSAPARKKQATAVDPNDKAARGHSRVSLRPMRTGPAGAAAIRVHP